MRYLAYRTIDGRDLFGNPVVDGLEILGLVDAPCLYPAAVRAVTCLGEHVGAMPWEAGTRAQKATALRLASMPIEARG